MILLKRAKAIEPQTCAGKQSIAMMNPAWMRNALAIALLLLPGCDDAPGEWAAIVYPDRTDRTRFDVAPRFKTFSYCRDQVIERMKAIQVKSGGDYECGFQCELAGDPHRVNVCKEIRK